MIGSCGTEGPSYGIAVNGNLAFLTDDYGRYLSVVDVSDPENPHRIGFTEIQGRAYDVAVSGNLAFVVGEGRFSVVDVSNAQEPGIMGTCNAGWGAVAVTDSLAIVAGNWLFDVSTIYVVDISDPQNPQTVGSIFDDDEFIYFNDVAISGHLAFVVGPRLYVVDISEAAKPQIIGACGAGGSGVAVSGNLVFVAHSYLEVVDVSDPENPREIGRSDTLRGGAESVAVSGNLAFTSSTWPAYLNVVDVRTPGNPREAGYYRFGNMGSGVAVNGELVYMAGGMCGYEFGIFRYQPEGPAIEITPEGIDFDSVLVHNTAELPLTIHNFGLDTLIVSEITIEGDPFSVRFEEEFNLEPDSSRDVIVTFAPDTAGAYEGTLTIASNDPLFEEYIVDLRGIGVQPGAVGDEFILHPSAFILSFFPNPFNSSTTITYALPVASSVSLALYHLSGRQVRTLVEGNQPAGVHRTVLTAADLPSGLYFIRMKAAEYVGTRKVMLIR